MKLASLQKFAPEGGSGKVKNVTTGLRVAGSGIGFTVVAQTIDSLALRGLIQSIGFNVPILNFRMSLIDLGNYLAHNGGNIMPKSSKPLIAVGASKVAAGSLQLTSLGRFGSSRQSGQSSGAGTTQQGASA